MSIVIPKFSPENHMEAVVARRIKFVVEKGAMARLFKKGCNPQLQKGVRQRINVDELKALSSVIDFDEWHGQIVRHDCWKGFTNSPIEYVRWGHFAKLVNIILYEMVSNNEIMNDGEANRLRGFLHLPIDQKVLNLLRRLQAYSRLPKKLQGMTQDDYTTIQQLIREEAAKQNIPAIWFEDAYSFDF